MVRHERMMIIQSEWKPFKLSRLVRKLFTFYLKLRKKKGIVSRFKLNCGSLTSRRSVLRSVEWHDTQREMNDSVYITDEPRVHICVCMCMKRAASPVSKRKAKGTINKSVRETQTRKVECSREGGFRGLMWPIDSRVLFGTLGIMAR